MTASFWQGFEKRADAAESIMRSGGFYHPDPPKAPDPPPAADAGGSFASRVTSGVKSLMGDG
jgi:hypothetical protein